ncbi:MAG: alcohol dehydrogenase catalytic domain-containing protein [Phycisphaerales bacterium]
MAHVCVSPDRGPSLETGASALAGEPGPGELRIRIASALISGLERAVAGGFGSHAGGLGHAGVGVVEAVGDAADAEWVGRRVLPAPVGWCGECTWCRGGLREHCETRTILGVRGDRGTIGATLTVPVRAVHPVPDDVTDEAAVFAPLLASALQVRRQVSIPGKPYVTVLGDGPLGLLAAQVLMPMNASVRVLGRYSEKLARCERWGIRHRHVDDVGRRGDQDIVVDCTGRSEGIELAAQLVRPRGTVILKSLVGPGGRLVPGADLDPLVMSEVSVVGSWFGPIGDALRLLAVGGVQTSELLDRRVRLDDATGQLAGPRSGGRLATLVDCSTAR